ncbi:MAG: TIGR02391 family protein [Solirubrobacterales bacterium]
MLSLSDTAIQSLPIDERALAILQDLLDTGEWNEYNYLLKYHGSPANAVAEGLAWLRGHAFIARTPDQSSDAAIFVTKRGQEALAQGVDAMRAVERLELSLHPLIERTARRQFLLGEYEQAVFVAMKAIEVRVRSLSGLGDEIVGVDLMSKAFRPDGPLTDSAAVKGEQVGTMNLFQGAYAVLRNPAGHREVDYSDVTEAAEAVATASLLMRILDRVEDRLAGP